MCDIQQNANPSTHSSNLDPKVAPIAGAAADGPQSVWFERLIPKLLIDH